MSGLSIVIITLDQREVLRKCLRHLHRHHDRFDEIVIVDNGSTDGTSEMIAAEFPDVRLSRLPENVGVPEGRNVAAGLALGELLFFHDDDACFDFDALPPMIRALEEFPEVAVATSRVVNLPGEDIFALDMARYRRPGQEPRPHHVFKGGACILKKRALLEAGGYPGYFFYCEEEGDLAYRLFRHGYRILHFESATMLHRKLTDDRTQERFYFFHYRNRLHQIWRNLPAASAVAGTVRLLGSGLVAALSTSSLVPFLKGFRSGLAAVPRIVRDERNPLTRKQFKEYKRIHPGAVGLKGKAADLLRSVRLWRSSSGRRVGR